MGNRQRRSGRLLVTALLVGAMSFTAPVAHAGPGSPPLPEGPWPPSEVLAADPATVAAPRVGTQAATACPAAGYGVNNSAPGSGKTVALTFDDGPGASTDAIMAILDSAGVAATFFNIGVNETVRPSTVRAEAARGYLLGSHSWSHPDLTTLSSSAQALEMDRTTAEQVSLVGSPPCFFRPPYGSYNSTTLALAQARNMKVWNWSVDTEDWKAAGSGSSSWVNRIISLAQTGGSQSHPVVLMHNQPGGNPATVSALPSIIRFYRSRGYTFVDLAGRAAARPPFGSLDSAAADGTGLLTVRGWTVDPDTLTVPTHVHVYVDGVLGAAVVADRSRPDVALHFPGAGNLHGFGASLQTQPGAHRVCVYAIDTTVSSRNTNLGCRTVAVSPRMPFGSLDVVAADAAGLISVRGWTIDPDTLPVSTHVHVYVDGVLGAAVVADRSRPDVALHFPGAGSLHGFGAAVQSGVGAHTVCVYAIDTSFSNLHGNLGCRTVG
jgi:peptidoglycan/xylan/chitin deacetylase (PgdA/CDA1 family)